MLWQVAHDHLFTYLNAIVQENGVIKVICHFLILRNNIDVFVKNLNP